MNVPTSNPDRRWERVLRSLTLAVAVAVVALLVPGDGQTQAPQSTTAQHQAIENQITTHDGNQTSQHHGLPQAWDKTLPANDPGGACPSNSSRFTCVMGGAAVRDNETGLVWEQSPVTTTRTWNQARNDCFDRTVGGRKGWRLPSVVELASLVDPSVPFPGPTTPPGIPFIFTPQIYWSATTIADDTTSAWDVSFVAGSVNGGTKTITDHVWCVRGGMNADQY